MPSDLYGFSGSEIVSYVQSWIGNTSSDFQSFLTQTLPLAEFRYCKFYDWSFLNKRALNLTVTSGTVDYNLSVATLGYYMPAQDISAVYSVSNRIFLEKRDLNDLRRMDPGNVSGNSTAKLVAWAPSGDNTITVFPYTFSDTQLQIDGKIAPAALSTLSNYPTIPYRYQDAFIQYFLSLALNRENDDRAAAQTELSRQLIKQDVAEDLGSQSDVKEPRLRHMYEQRLDGVSANLDSLYNQWAWLSQD